MGNISPADIRRTIEIMPTWLHPGGSVVWTRHRRAPDLTPSVREWFAGAGFEEASFESPEEFVLTVGRHRLTNADANAASNADAGASTPVSASASASAPPSFDPHAQLFTFRGDGSRPA
jgi:hypothetical protein